MTHSAPRRVDTAGFTLVELTIVALVVGVLATLALPRLQIAVQRARAADVIADLNAVRLAAHEAMAKDGAFPAQAAWGVVPPRMRPHLPAKFTFVQGDLRYRWRLFSAADSPWGVPTGRFQVRLARTDRRLIDALASMTNPQLSIVQATQINFWVLP